MTEMIKLADQDFKVVIKNVFKELKKKNTVLMNSKQGISTEK